MEYIAAKSVVPKFFIIIFKLKNYGMKKGGEYLTDCSFDEGRVLFNLPSPKACKGIGKQQGEKEVFFIFIFGGFFLRRKGGVFFAEGVFFFLRRGCDFGGCFFFV